MSKDRFSKFKPINWNSDWKKTGNFGSRYNTLERKDAYDAYRANQEYKDSISVKQQVSKPVKPKKELRTLEQNNVLYHILDLGKEHMSEWELNFMNSILSVPYQISPKQKEIIKGIIRKYDLEKSVS